MTYSYLILRRGPSTLTTATDPVNTWPRLIRDPLKATGHVTMDWCSPNGHLERAVVAKSQGQPMWYDARKARWGDAFPWPGKTVVASNLVREQRKPRHMLTDDKESM